MHSRIAQECVPCGSASELNLVGRGRSIGSRRHTGSSRSIEFLPKTPCEVLRLHPQFRDGGSLQQAAFLRTAQRVQVRYPFPVHVVLIPPTPTSMPKNKAGVINPRKNNCSTSGSLSL